MTGRCWWAGRRGHARRHLDGVAANLTPTYPLAIGGYTFPGYTALYTVILNLVLVIVLTPVFNMLGAGRAPADETVAADYHG